jgi:hypothetical protein
VPRIAPAWTDINSSTVRTGPPAINFPVQAIGFAGVNDFKIRWINVPVFGNEQCRCGNTFSMSLFDDGSGLDENANEPFNGINPVGNNSVQFDLKEGPTALRWTRNDAAQLVGRTARPSGSGYVTFTYGRMDLIGSQGQPVMVGIAAGGVPIGDPGQQTVNMSSQAGRIGDGSQLAIFEFFDTGTLANPAFDLRFDGNDPALCTPTGQADANRGVLQFTGFTFPGHVPFVNEPAIANVSPILASDVTELRTRIAALRSRVPALGPFAYTDLAIVPGSTTTMARVINEMRSALSEVYVAYELPPPAYTDTLTPGVTPIKAIHIQELRDLVGAIE